MTESRAPISRAGLPIARRVVVKIGSSSLTGEEGYLDLAKLRAIVTMVAAKHAQGCQVVLVSSGALAAAMGPLGLTRKPRDLATAQAAASVGQGILIARYAEAFIAHQLRVGQVLLTAGDLIRRSHYRNAHRTLRRLLRLGVVPIVNENDTVATDELRFGDNDRLAALVAHLVSADALVLATDVDALYTAPPGTPGSQRLARVDSPAQLAEIKVTGRGSSVGTGGMVSKVAAAQLAAATGIPTLITSAAKVAAALGVAGAAREETGAADDEDPAAIGTWFVPGGNRVPAKQLWLAHAADVRGRVTIDDGAARAVRSHGKSLLLAGVVGVAGDFGAGDPVEIATIDGRVIARGLAGYGSGEVPGLMGRSSADLAAVAGRPLDPEMTHRDEMVLLPGS